MRYEEEIEFAKRVEKDDKCKVKFYEYIENEGGPFTRWSFHFDGDTAVHCSPGCAYLTTAIHDYLVYSSQRIKELEAQLALAKLFSENPES